MKFDTFNQKTFEEELKKLPSGKGIGSWLSSPVQETRPGFSVVANPSLEQRKQHIMDRTLGFLGITDLSTGLPMTVERITEALGYGPDTLVRLVFQSQRGKHTPSWLARDVSKIVSESGGSKEEVIGGLKDLFVKYRLGLSDNEVKQITEKHGSKAVKSILDSYDEGAKEVSKMIKDLE